MIVVNPYAVRFLGPGLPASVDHVAPPSIDLTGTEVSFANEMQYRIWELQLANPRRSCPRPPVFDKRHGLI